MVHGDTFQPSVEPSSSRSLLNTPPPPYKDAGTSPLVVTETTTRTEVVTTTTTHFFSLPIWRRRAQPSSSRPNSTYESKSTRPSSIYDPSSLTVCEDGALIPQSGLPRSGSLMLEKALPPIPPPQPHTSVDFPVSSRSLPSLPSSTESNGSRPPRSFPQSPNKSPGLYSFPSHSQTALAQASLGLTLSHILPSDSSSTTEVNTIAFVTSPASPTDAAPPPLRLRHKSSQKLKSNPTASKLSIEDGDERRRTRGFSFGPASFLNFTPEAKSKGKDKTVETPIDDQPIPRTLSRKGSFWSRKKSLTSADDLPRPTTNVLDLPPLPPVQPLSPFNVNLDLPLSSGPPTLQSLSIPAPPRGLSRSLSERTSPKYAEQSPIMAHSPVIATESPHSLSPTSPLPITVDSSLLHESQKFAPRLDAPIARPRAHTNPPLLRRLSFNMLSQGSIQTPPSKSANVSPSSSSPSSTRPSSEKRRPVIPRPLPNGDSPSLYLDRLLSAVSKAEVVGILASSTDAIHVEALRAYLDRFDFLDDPLDVALRKLLMDISLPRETQQIDRVIEAFAARYLRCNPALFTSEDQPYILAFSLIMLHTDAFNKSNKRKMTKADYVKNTRLPGVASEVLDCFYDNIVFAPFIFIEDPMDVHGQRGLSTEGSSSRLSSPAAPSNPGMLSGSASSLLGKGNKVDPYHLITNNLLGALRVDVESFVPLKDPLSVEGTTGAVDQALLQQAFARARSIEIAPQETRANSFHSMSPGGIPSPILASPLPKSREIFILKLTKVGVLDRKDDLLESGRKASNRRWKPYSVLLTGSQLLFCKDTNWAATVLDSLNSSHGTPQPLSFRPDELVSLKDAIAVYDRSYTKHEHTLRFATSDGRQMLLRARDEIAMNEWISRINYASAFKSHGVRMRSSGMSGRDLQLTGIAAATSHLHDLQHLEHSGSSTTRLHRWDNDAPENLMMMLTGSPEVTSPRTSIDAPAAPEIDGAEQFKATFDQVKADLAAGRWALADLSNTQPSGSTTPIPRRDTSVSLWDEASPFPSRYEIIQSKIRDLESKISTVQIQLDTDIRFLRNIATLTPFQKATRDRLYAAIQPVVKRIKQIRINMARLTCHRDVLSKDLDLETQDWRWAHEMALKAATDTLQTRQRSGRTPQGSPVSATSNETPPPTARPESAASESFHSAVDFGSDSEEHGMRSGDRSGAYCESPKPSSSESLPAFPFPPSDQGGHLAQPDCGDISESARTSVESQLHERFYTAAEELPEEAEEWNKTRCANRVSLVRLPSDMRLSRRFSKHRTDRPFA